MVSAWEKARTVNKHMLSHILSLGFHLSISGLIESVYRAAKVLTDQQAALSSRSMFA